MLEIVTQALRDGSSGAIALPLAFMLGLLSAVASACCTLPAMGMLVAYSGSRETYGRRSTALSALWFLLGTTFSLIILGAVAGLLGQAAQTFLGRYQMLFAGVVAVIMGLGTLKLLPLPAFFKGGKKQSSSTARGGIDAALGGIFLGGGVAACSLPCNPGIFIILGASVLMGKIVWGMVLMAAFSVGFSLPLATILFGVSFGKASIKAGRDRMLKQLAQDVFREANKNLSGPRYGKAQKYRGSQTGQMPIPVLSANLKGSLTMTRLDQGFMVYSDSTRAPYNWFVHKGTSKMRGRRFLGDAVDTVQRVYLNQNKKEFVDVIRFVGRS